MRGEVGERSPSPRPPASYYCDPLPAVRTFRPAPSTLAIALVLLFFAVITLRWSWNQGPGVIRSDAAGYYGYLRALFITGDLGHERFDHVYMHRTPEGGTLNKYFAGTAVLELPFFLGAHALAPALGAPRDGLAWPYQRAISLAALVYAALGLLLFRRVLRALSVGEATQTTLILLLGFATQLVQYVSIQPGWSHVYSFFLVSGWLHLTQRYTDAPTRSRLLAWAAVFGLIVLVRPVNGLVGLAVPVVLGARTIDWWRALWRDIPAVLLAALAFGAVVGVQALLWYVQTGRLVADGYKGEGFHWDRPEVFQVLFGVRRGLFVWAPALLAAAVAVPLLWRGDRVRAIGAALYWAANTYVISCWWIWFYGSGWGQRVYVDHYPVILIPLAIWLERMAPGLRNAVRAFLLLAAALTMAQFHQFNHRLLHVECMDKRKYAYAFLRFDEAHRDRLGGNYRIAPFNPNGLDTLLHARWDAEAADPHWHGRTAIWFGAPSADHVAQCAASDAYGPEFVLGADALPAGRDLYLAIGFERRVWAVDDTRGILGVVTVERPGGQQSYYESFPMEPLPPLPGVWEHIEYRIAIPAVQPGEYLKFYFWNQKNNTGFVADDLDATVMAVRPY